MTAVMRRAEAAQRVDGDQELHQIVVGGVGGRLDDEDVLAADVLVDLDEDLHIGEAADAGLGQRQVQAGGNGLRQRPVAVAGEDLHIATPAAGRFIGASLISDDKTAIPGRDAADHTNTSRFCKRPEISCFFGLFRRLRRSIHRLDALVC